MQRINKNEVELTPTEQLVQQLFERKLDEGLGMIEARDWCGKVLAERCPAVSSTLGRDFWSWLAD